MTEPLNRQQYVEYCKNCANKSFNNQVGLICNLTNEKPDFSINCVKYSPVNNELEEVRQQLEQLKAKKRKRKIILVASLISSMAVLTFFVIYGINGALENRKLSRGFERTAGTFFKEKDYNGAIYYYKISIEYDDQNITAIHSLGRSYEKLESYNEAIKYYSNAIQLNSNYALAFRSRAYVRYLIKDYPLAIEDYKESLVLEPQNTSALSNIGSIYEEMCDFEVARKYYYEALKYNPVNYGVMSSLASLEFHLKNYDVCIDLCYKVIGNLEFEKDVPHGILGLAYQAINKYDSAMIHLNKAIEYDPTSSHYYNNRGWTLGIMGKKLESITDYNRAIEIDSLNPTFFLNRGDSKYDLELHTDAIEDYNKSISLSVLYEGYNCGGCYHSRAYAKLAIGDSIGYNKDIAKADSLGYPESHNPWSNLGAKADFYNKK